MAKKIQLQLPMCVYICRIVFNHDLHKSVMNIFRSMAKSITRQTVALTNYWLYSFEIWAYPDWNAIEYQPDIHTKHHFLAWRTLDENIIHKCNDIVATKFGLCLDCCDVTRGTQMDGDLSCKILNTTNSYRYHCI